MVLELSTEIATLVPQLHKTLDANVRVALVELFLEERNAGATCGVGSLFSHT